MDEEFENWLEEENRLGEESVELFDTEISDELDDSFNRDFQRDELRNSREALEIDPVNDKGEDFDTWFDRRIDTDDYDARVEDVSSGSWATPLKGGLASIATGISTMSKFLGDRLGTREAETNKLVLDLLSGKIDSANLPLGTIDAKDVEEMSEWRKWFVKKNAQVMRGFGKLVESATDSISEAIDNNETVQAWAEANARQAAGELNPFEDDASLNEVAKTWASNVAEQVKFLASHAGGPMTAMTMAYSGMEEEYINTAKSHGFSDEMIDKFREPAVNLSSGLEYAGELFTLGLGRKLGGKLPLLNKIKGKAASIAGSLIAGKIVGAGAEGLTEWTQQAVLNHYMGKMARESGMSDEEIIEKFKNTPLWNSRDFWVGAGVSAIVGTAGDISNKVSQHKVSKAQKIIADKVADAQANILQVELSDDSPVAQEIIENNILAEAERRVTERSQEEVNYQAEIDDMTGYDKRVLAGAVDELYGDTVNPNTLADAEGNISEEVKFELDELASEKAAVEIGEQSDIDAKIDRMEAELEREEVVKDIKSKIKDVHNKALETKDKSRRRELLLQELELTNVLEGVEESKAAIEEEALVLQDIERMEAEVDIEDLTSEDAVQFEDEGFGRERLDGRDYMTKQVEVMESIKELTGMDDVETGKFYTEHFAEAFEENHKIHPAEVESIVEEETIAEEPPKLVDTPLLSEVIQELKTDEELRRAEAREARVKVRETAPKARAEAFEEIAEGKIIKPITTDVNRVMSWLESQSKKVASGVRTDIVAMQKELAKITRDVMPTNIRGRLLGRMSDIAKIKNSELRSQKFNEAIEYIQEQAGIEGKRIAIRDVKKTIKDLKAKQRKVTTKKGREGFGTKETAKLRGKVVDLRAESSLTGKKLAKTQDKKEQAKLKTKITRLNQEAARLEAFNTLAKTTEGPNEAIRAQLNNIVAISEQRIKKIEKAQEDYLNGKIEAIPNQYQKDIEDIASGKINIDSLTENELQQLNDKLQALAEGKKAIANYIHNETQQQAQARLALSLEELTKNHGVKVQAGPKKQIKGGILAGLKAYVRRPRLAIQALAGGTDTHTYANTVGKVDQAFNNSLAISEFFNEKKGEVFGKINEKVIGSGLDFFDAITKPDTEINGEMHSKNEIMELYALSQSPDGQRVLENTGYDTDPKVYSKMLGKDYTDAVNNYLNFLSSEMYDTLNVEYKRQHGIDMPRVEGKYFPLMSIESIRDGEALSLEDFGGQYIAPHLNDGMTHERVPHNYQLGSLDFFGKTSLYEKRAARFAGEAELLSQVQQLIKSREFQNTVNAINKPYMTSINQWIDRVIAGSQFENATRDTLWDGIFALKSQFVRSVLPTRLSVIAKQIPSFVGATPELTGKGFSDSLHAIVNPVAINDFVNSKSTMMRNRLDNSIQRLSENIKPTTSKDKIIKNEALRQTKKGLHALGNISDEAFKRGIGATDKLVTNSLWYGKYMDEVRAGKSEEKAAIEADELITRTQPTFNNKDLSQMNRNRLVSIFKMFSSQLDQNMNRIIDAIEGKDMGLSAKERGARVQGVVQSTALISTLTLLMRWASKYYDDEQDPEDKMTPYEYLAENIGKQFSMDASHGIFGGVPVINTTSDILTMSTYNKMFDKEATFYEYRNQLQGVLKSPVGQVVDDVLQAYNHKLNGNDELAMSTLGRVVEKLSGVPYSGAKTSYKQVGGVIKYLSDQLKDGDPRKQKLEEINF